MPWTDGSGPAPDRSEHELLALVRSKAGRIRRRRTRASASVAALAGMALLILAVGALAGNGPGRPSTLRVVGPAPTSSSGPTAAASSTTPAPDPTSTTQPAPSTTLRTVPAPTTTIGTTPPTTAPRAPTTTVPGPTTSTSPPAVAATPCSPAEVLFLVTTDKPAYAPGDTVRVSASVQNRSGHPCARPNGTTVGFRNAAGARVGISIAGHGDYVEGSGPSPWAPGETIMVINSQLGTWDQKDFDGKGMAQVPGGTYTVVASEGDFSGQASFTIV